MDTAHKSEEEKEITQNDQHQDEQVQMEVDEQVKEEEQVKNENNQEENPWEKKFQEMNDKYLRLYSEFENFRKRTSREKMELAQSASGDFVKRLLTVLDDFDRAIASNSNIEDANVLREGFTLIHNKLKSVLQQNGLEEMKSVGEVFDTDKHEAITNIPASSDDMKGKVMDEAEKGYYFNGKVLRYAKVVVGQ